MRVTRAILGASILLCGFVLMSGCDQTFEPLQENNLYNFNISGYLDVSADTQWVHIGTIRESIDEPPDPTGIRVTLENLQSGESVVMNDSVFIYKNVLNYWTTMDIKNDQTYRITAEGSDSKTSEVTVTTPKKLPTIYIIINANNPFYGGTSGATIYIDAAIKDIVDVQSVWYVTLKSGTEYRKRIYKFPLRNNLKRSDVFGDSYAFANWEEEREQIKQGIGKAEISRATRQFFVATGGPEWDAKLASIDDIEYFLDETASDVENGLGFVVGINSGWFWQAPCLRPDSSNYAPCEPEAPFW